MNFPAFIWRNKNVILQFLSPTCPQKPSRISAKIKILLMHKGGKERRLRKTRCTQTWQTPVLVSVWGLRQPSQGKSLSGQSYRYIYGSCASVTILFSHLHSNPHLLTASSPWIENYPFTLKSYWLNSCFLSLAKIVLLRKGNTLNMLSLCFLCLLWTEEIKVFFSIFKV